MNLAIDQLRIKPAARASILDRPIPKARSSEVGLNAFSFLFAELVQFCQKKTQAVNELEKKLHELGYRVGSKALELVTWRDRSNKRETKILGVLSLVSTSMWRMLFGKQADSLERSNDEEDQYMIIDNDPLINRYISVPRDFEDLNCGAFVAGVIEAVLAGCQFPSTVTAHSARAEGFPNRTIFLIKFEPVVLSREKALER